MASQFEMNEILRKKQQPGSEKNIIRDNIYPSSDDTFHADDSIICSRMD